MNIITIENMKKNITEYINNIKATSLIYSLTYPVLVEWEGKKITKRLVTKMLSVFSSDFHIYLKFEYGFTKLIISKNERMVIFYIGDDRDKIFYMNYFLENNKGYEGSEEKIQKFTEALENIEKWHTKLEKIHNDVTSLKKEMGEYDCKYIIEWDKLIK